MREALSGWDSGVWLSAITQFIFVQRCHTKVTLRSQRRLDEMKYILVCPISSCFTPFVPVSCPV